MLSCSLLLGYIGLKSVDISVPEQTVSMVVEPEVLYDIVLDKIRGTGKTVRSGGVDGVAREFEMLSMAWLKSWKSMLGFFSLW